MLFYVFNVAMSVIIASCTALDLKNIDSPSNNIQPTEIFFHKNQDNTRLYDDYIYCCAKNYGVDACLIKSIIQVESNYNPTVISKSNAIGLMQIKADTAGKDAYRLKGWSGKPSTQDLQDAAINIDLGTAYLFILQKQLENIINLETRRYALIVSYVNGLGELLRMFSVNHACAIHQINKLSSDQFYQYIQSHHPSKQAQHYLFKVNSIFCVLQKTYNK